MFDIMRGNPKFDKQFKSVHDLARHKLFEERFTTFEISLICKQMLDRGNKNQDYDFDSMVEEQKLKKQNINALVELQYRHISTKYRDIVPIILMLALMTNGMTLADLQRIMCYVHAPHVFGKCMRHQRVKRVQQLRASLNSLEKTMVNLGLDWAASS